MIIDLMFCNFYGYDIMSLYFEILYYINKCIIYIEMGLKWGGIDYYIFI